MSWAAAVVDGVQSGWEYAHGEKVAHRTGCKRNGIALHQWPYFACPYHGIRRHTLLHIRSSYHRDLDRVGHDHDRVDLNYGREDLGRGYDDLDLRSPGLLYLGVRDLDLHIPGVRGLDRLGRLGLRNLGVHDLGLLGLDVRDVVAG